MDGTANEQSTRRNRHRQRRLPRTRRIAPEGTPPRGPGVNPPNGLLQGQRASTGRARDGVDAPTGGRVGGDGLGARPVRPAATTDPRETGCPRPCWPASPPSRSCSSLTASGREGPSSADSRTRGRSSRWRSNRSSPGIPGSAAPHFAAAGRGGGRRPAARWGTPRWASPDSCPIVGDNIDAAAAVGRRLPGDGRRGDRDGPGRSDARVDRHPDPRAPPPIGTLDIAAFEARDPRHGGRGPMSSGVALRALEAAGGDGLARARRLRLSGRRGGTRSPSRPRDPIPGLDAARHDDVRQASTATSSASRHSAFPAPAAGAATAGRLGRATTAPSSSNRSRPPRGAHRRRHLDRLADDRASSAAGGGGLRTSRISTASSRSTRSRSRTRLGDRRRRGDRGSRWDSRTGTRPTRWRSTRSSGTPLPGPHSCTPIRVSAILQAFLDRRPGCGIIRTRDGRRRAGPAPVDLPPGSEPSGA